MSGYVTIKRGRVAIVHCRLPIVLADINAEVGEPSGTFMSIYETNRRRIARKHPKVCASPYQSLPLAHNTEAIQPPFLLNPEAAFPTLLSEQHI